MYCTKSILVRYSSVGAPIAVSVLIFLSLIASLFMFGGVAHADSGTLKVASSDDPVKISSATSSYALYTANGKLVPCTKTGKQKAKAWSVTYNEKTDKYKGDFEDLKIRTLFIASNAKTVKETGTYTTAYKGFKFLEFDTPLGGIPCSKVVFLKNSKGVNACTSIGKSAFRDSSAKSFVNFNKTRVKTIGQSAFFGGKVTSVALPPTLKAFSGKNAFANCDKLTAVVGLDKTKLGAIAEGTFFGCSKLKSVALPKTCVSIGKQAFEYCSALSKVKFNNKLKSIDESGFAGCEKLAAVDLPASVRSLGTGVFYDNASLKSLILRSKALVKVAGPSKYKNLLIAGTPIGDGANGATIKVPRSLLGKYKANKDWKAYGALIKAF